MEKKTREEKCLYKWPETRIHDDDEGKNGKNKIHRQTATSQLLFYFARSLRRLVKGVHRWKFLSMFLEPICIFFFYFFTYQQKKGNLCFLFFFILIASMMSTSAASFIITQVCFLFFSFSILQFWPNNNYLQTRAFIFFPLPAHLNSCLCFFRRTLWTVFLERRKSFSSQFSRCFVVFFFRLPLPFFFLFCFVIFWFGTVLKVGENDLFRIFHYFLFFQPPTTKKRKE